MQYSASKKSSDSRARLLRDLGSVVRARRTKLGLTIRALAKDAGVSERFLAQLEAGEGNISVARLEDVGEALGTNGAELLASASRPKAAASARPVLALVGLRGAGKSSIGSAVASTLGVPFVELDELIVREAQMTLSTLFEIHGEGYYRSVEREVLRRFLARDEPAVLATGGSLVTDPETWGLLRRRAHTVWLKATADEHWSRVVTQGDARPMRDRPRAMNELRALLTSREPLYRQADAVVDTSARNLDDVIAEVIGHVEGPAESV